MQESPCTHCCLCSAHSSMSFQRRSSCPNYGSGLHPFASSAKLLLVWVTVGMSPLFTGAVRKPWGESNRAAHPEKCWMESERGGLGLVSAHRRKAALQGMGVCSDQDVALSLPRSWVATKVPQGGFCAAADGWEGHVPGRGLLAFPLQTKQILPCPISTRMSRQTGRIWEGTEPICTEKHHLLQLFWRRCW